VTITEEDVQFEVSVVKLLPDPQGNIRPTLLKYIDGDLPRTLEMLLDGVRIVAKLMMKGSTETAEQSRIIKPGPLPFPFRRKP
jgi:hypothetical protein